MLLIVTGTDAFHFSNLRILIGSWGAHMNRFPLAVCDYGMSAEQVEELRSIRGVEVLPIDERVDHPWLGKALLGKFLRRSNVKWEILMWLDADACFTHPTPDIPPLLAGYDMLLDAHVQSVGEIAHACNRDALGLRSDDAYYAAGWWVARRGCLLDNYEAFTRKVQGEGNLWEGDSFVAAIYRERLKIRNVSGSIWHCRGKTSLHSCQVEGLTPMHAGHPIYVLHANDGYTVTENGRRVFKRPELAAIQAHHEKEYFKMVARPRQE
ncbi:MAG: hypothetical protein Q7S40_23915 [Opitutaceae bacterium]|nr:hypothetical protein [Opitutaceae bacterium]